MNKNKKLTRVEKLANHIIFMQDYISSFNENATDDHIEVIRRDKYLQDVKHHLDICLERFQQLEKNKTLTREEKVALLKLNIEYGD